MSRKKRNAIFSICGLFIIIGVIILYSINTIFSTKFSIDSEVYLYIDKKTDYNDILDQIQTKAKINNIANFEKISSFMRYPDNIKTGRYKVTPDMSALDLVWLLKNGNQTPVSLKFNNIRTKEDLTKRLSDQLSIPEGDLLRSLTDSTVARNYGFSGETFVTMFIPNTYEIYWDIKTDKFLDRMNNEYNRFWSPERINKAKELGLTPIEVSILASIIEEECYFSDEYPTVAGLYLNRLKKGQLLQADPTVKFAVGDFSLKRILNKHLAVDSPYNTYKHIGLPPGPVRVPSIKAIDATLNPAEHEYYYMCAKDDFSGRHNFATSYAEHTKNAERYRVALNKRNIF